MFEQNLEKLGLSLPKISPPVAKYAPYVKIGSRVIISGQISKDIHENLIVGTLGNTVSVNEGVAAAQRCGLYILAVLKEALNGDLSQVKKCVKLNGFVASNADFKDHPQVINGASELMVNVFGEEIGMHARAAVGMSSLPLGVCVEIDAEFEVLI
ncbi:MAG: enamine deaminase RidA (YjgF/YER057c/UK114 family) [Alphaproteobacteria bacterium]|jgi:enamine deaminase RidA (YjgF/YER057c/UK114 family)